MSHYPQPPRRGAVAVIVRHGRFLLVRRSRWVEAPRTYCFPGGAIEDGETEQETVVRELREELGVEARPQRRLWHSVTPWHVHLAWWLTDLAPQAHLQPDPAEVESVHWHTPEEMAALGDLLSSNREFLEAVARGEIELRT